MQLSRNVRVSEKAESRYQLPGPGFVVYGNVFLGSIIICQL